MSDIDPTELERVIRKIKHCLALSTSSNEHEAATAMRQAQALMSKYRLTETEVNLSDVGMSKSDKEKTKREQWERLLSSVVAMVFDCETLTSISWSSTKLCRVETAVFIGVAPAPEIARYAYDTLHRQCVAARKAYVGAINRREIPSTGVSAKARGGHFAIYWVQQVEKKLQALVPTGEDDPEQSESNTRALIAIKSKSDELIQAYISNLTDGKGPTPGASMRRMKISGLDALHGAEAGRKAQVSHGVGTAGEQLAAIGQAPMGTQGSFL